MLLGLPVGRLREVLRPRRLLEPPVVPRAGEEHRLAVVELEHRGRHGLEEPAVVRDEDDRGVERSQHALEPLERLDVEVVRRLVEQQQVGLRGERARERGARQLAAGEGRERPVEVVVREAEPAHDGRRAVAPVVAAGVLEPVPAPRSSGEASPRRGRRSPSPAPACGARPRRAARSAVPASTYSRSGLLLAPAAADRAARPARPSPTRARRRRASSRPRARAAASSCPRRSARRAPAGRGARP